MAAEIAGCMQKDCSTDHDLLNMFLAIDFNNCNYLERKHTKVEKSVVVVE